MSVILAILQNQWFKDPGRVRRLIASTRPAEEMRRARRRFLRRALFRGCRTGVNLNRVFGDWCERIVWEEASPEIGGNSASVFPADPAHLSALLAELNPRIVLAFGRVASNALAPLCAGRCILIIAPHPAARAGDTLRRLGDARRELESLF